VGNARSRVVQFLNKGGPGRFLLLSAAEWAAKTELAATQQKEPCQDAAGCLFDLCLDGKDPAPAMAAGHTTPAASLAPAAAAAAVSGAFRVAPTFFDLGAGGAGQFEVVFSPEHLGSHSGCFVLVWDNCTVQQLDLHGLGAAVEVELVEVDGRQAVEADQQVPLWFGQVGKPGSTTAQTQHLPGAVLSRNLATPGSVCDHSSWASDGLPCCSHLDMFCIANQHCLAYLELALFPC